MLPEDEVRRELKRFEANADWYQARARYPAAEMYRRDAELLRWVLNDDEEKTA